jgi:fructose/tagatose bisphosphate aldolase
MMAIRNVYPWIKRAQQSGYAIGAFNANTMEQMQAIVLACRGQKVNPQRKVGEIG